MQGRMEDANAVGAIRPSSSEVRERGGAAHAVNLRLTCPLRPGAWIALAEATWAASVSLPALEVPVTSTV
jgi:hypothetical protein